MDMDNNLYSPETMQEEVEHYTGEIIETPVVKQTGIGAWLAGYTTTELRRSALIDAERERCRAYLTATALQHAAILSGMEAVLTKANPSAADRFKGITDAYCVKAIERIKES